MLNGRVICRIGRITDRTGGEEENDDDDDDEHHMIRKD